MDEVNTNNIGTAPVVEQENVTPPSFSIPETPTTPKPKKNYFFAIFILILVFAVISYYFILKQSQLVLDPKIAASETPTPTETVIPSVTIEVTVTPTQSPIPTVKVNGNGVVTFIDGNTLHVFTKDLEKITDIKTTGNIVTCHGSSSDYCLITGSKIKALEVDRSGKLVATQEFDIEISKSELEPYTAFIDLTRKSYVYMKSDAKDEMKLTFYKKNFTGTPARALKTWEAGGVSGDVTDAILSTGETVIHRQGSVYQPGDARTLEIVNESGKIRNCETKEYMDAYYGDYRYFVTDQYTGSEKAQVIEFKKLNLLTCQQTVIEKISNAIDGTSPSIGIYDNKYLALSYTDVKKALHTRVFQLSNLSKAVTESVTANAPEFFSMNGFRSDTSSVFGLNLGEDTHLITITGSKVTLSKYTLLQTLPKREETYQGFLIP